MKHLLLLLALVFGLTSLPATSLAKDKHKDDDDWHKSEKHLRSDLEHLQHHYDMAKDGVKYLGGDRRQWEALHRIREDINRINWEVENGRYDGRDIRYRVDRAESELQRIQQEVDYNSKRHKGGYYRSY